MDAAVLVGVDYGDDVRVAQPAAASTSRRNRETRSCLRRERRRQDLERDDPAKPAMPGLEDDPHASLAQSIEDQIAADQEPAPLPLPDGRAW